MPRYLLAASLFVALGTSSATADPLAPGDQFDRLQNGYFSHHEPYPTVIDGHFGAWTAGRLLDPEGNPLLCVASGDRQKLTFIVGEPFGLQILATYAGLEAGSNYSLKVTAGSVEQTFNMSTTGPSTLWSDIEPKDFVNLMAAMDKAPHVELDQGGSKQTISLSGSTKALNLFRVCAIYKEVNTPGGDRAAAKLVEALNGSR